MAWAALCALVYAGFACGGSIPGAVDGVTVQTVHGAIVVVEARSLLELASLELRDKDGAAWHFKAEGYQGFTPSHLREHMGQGVPVTVSYHTEDGVLMIDSIDD